MWSKTKIKQFQQALLDWYDQEGRDLPWRQDHDPYHVMVSEIMLQQTQVQTVIPYYERFIAQFPTVQTLATAPEAQVLKAWEGLGYYSRARNLQRAAQQVVQDYAGQWPQTAAELQKLQGIGPYTAGAIASIAFNEVVPAVDGNAFRVFSRLFKIDADIAQPKTRALFAEVIQQLLPTDRPGDFNQAVMDLGSTYMRAKDPDPAHSPVAAFDQSYIDDVVLDYPVKSKKAKPVVKQYFALAIHSPKGWLFVKRPSTGMLADLWMFPLINQADLDDTVLEDEAIQLAGQQFANESGLTLDFANAGAKLVKHTFTHQQWQLTILRAESSATSLQYLPAQWVPAMAFDTIALPTVQKKLNQALDLEQK